MDVDRWTRVKSEGPDTGSDSSACRHMSDLGRVLHSPECRRVAVEFQGAWLVLRHEEVHRLGEHLHQLTTCAWTRSRLAAGERIRLRDALGAASLHLDLRGLQDLRDLLRQAIACPRFPAPFAAREAEEHPAPPYQSALHQQQGSGPCVPTPTTVRRMSDP
ncbi:MAG TPA: hypothetical protein VK465_03915 [Fibrobacteria bacterium]|nr:hypothetical protein [Fibrobacteria bacterium]